MSWTTSARLGRGQTVVAIVGATGRLGNTVTSTFLSTYAPFFRVVGITRDASTPAACALLDQGADIKAVPEWTEDALRAALQDVDVVVSMLGGASVDAKDTLVRASISAGARAYFCSEYGVDHRLNDFPGFDHDEWVHKREHTEHARALAKGKLKVVSVYSGWFLETGIAPWVGFDFSSRSCTCFGPPAQKVAFTSKADIARALAELCLLVSQSNGREKVPDDVRLAGSVASFEDIARMYAPDVEVRSLDLAAAKDKLKADYATNPAMPPADHIRVLMGEGKMDWVNENDNELVNPGERMWKWKTIEEQVKEMREAQ